MNEIKLKQIEALYHAARELSGEARARFLSQAGVSNARLKAEVEALLATEEAQDDVLSRPALTSILMLLTHSRQ
jgi:hypothetical protein